MGSSPPHLEIRTLGGVAALRAGSRLSVGGAQTRLLLAFLVYARGREIARDDLVEAVWGRRPPARADVGLRALLSKLRAVLGVSLLEGRLPAPVALPDGVSVDLAAIESLTARAESALATGEDDRAVERARAALALDHGPFAAGLEADWLDDARREQHSVRERALEVAARAALSAEDPEAKLFGAWAARELCAQQPYSESAHLILMCLLAADGDRAQALALYDRLRRRLRDELGLIPAAEIRELHRRLLVSDDGGPPADALPRQRLDAPSSADLTFALRAAGRWHDADSPSELAAAAITDLHRLVACDGVGWNDVDLTASTVEFLTSPSDYDLGSPETLDRLIHQNPIVANADRARHGATMFSDFTSVRQYHHLEIYHDLYRPLGVEDQLAVLLAVSPRRIIGIAFNRDRRSFTDRDRTLLQLLRPHLIAAHRNLQLRAPAEAPSSAGP